jgi:hypothetical protein
MVAVAVASVLFGSCTTYNSLKSQLNRPRVASVMTGSAPLPLIFPPLPMPEEDSASAYLELGFLSFQRNDNRQAVLGFMAAIATGDLNDAGRALAYWHIAIAEQRLNDEDRTAEAFMSFVLVGEDVLDARATHPYALNNGTDFVDQFNLTNRMSEARGFLSAAWARRVDDFGRTLDAPVMVRSELEAEAFVNFAPPCADAVEKEVTREVLASVETARVERVNISCEMGDEAERFFLIFVLPAAQ